MTQNDITTQFFPDVMIFRVISCHLFFNKKKQLFDSPKTYFGGVICISGDGVDSFVSLEIILTLVFTIYIH